MLFYFFAPSDSRFSNSCISAKYCPIQQTIHQWEAYLFSFQMMYKSQFQEIDLYDWFCGPGSHIRIGTRLKSSVFQWCMALHSDQNDVIIIGGGGRDRSAPPQRRTASSSTGQHSAAQRATAIPITAGGSSVSRASFLSNNRVKFLHIAPKTWTRDRQGIWTPRGNKVFVFPFAYMTSYLTCRTLGMLVENKFAEAVWGKYVRWWLGDAIMS